MPNFPSQELASSEKPDALNSCYGGFFRYTA